MAANQLTDSQKRAVDIIVNHMREYLDLRYHMALRANPRFESSWPDLQWLTLQQLRNTLSGEKMWGPDRFVVGEIFVSNDNDKIRDLFSSTNQRSILNEVVERKDKEGHKTADVQEIHDFRSLYSAIDPNIANIAGVMQTYVWWDLPDAVTLARFHFKAQRFRELSTSFEDKWIKFYNIVIGRAEDDPPLTQEDILEFEAKQLTETAASFCRRRMGEAGYQIILARQVKPEEHADALITRIARELLLLQSLEKGSAPDAATKEFVAKALHSDPERITDETVKNYLLNTITDHKAKLKAALVGDASGDNYNFKESQARMLVQRLKEIVGNRGRTANLANPSSDEIRVG